MAQSLLSSKQQRCPRLSARDSKVSLQATPPIPGIRLLRASPYESRGVFFAAFYGKEYLHG